MAALQPLREGSPATYGSMITIVPPGGEVWNGKERIMVQKNKKGHLLAKAALVVSIVKDVAIVLIEIAKLLRK